MVSKNVLGITVEELSKKEVLEKIKKYLENPSGFFHITSLNPEILVLAQKDKVFKEVIETSQIKIIDGVGVALAGKMLGISLGERMTGVEGMEELVKLAHDGSLRVMFIGGKANLAERVAMDHILNNIF